MHDIIIFKFEFSCFCCYFKQFACRFNKLEFDCICKLNSHILFFFFKQSFIAPPHTIISEVCFNNRESHSLIFGVILNFLSTFLSWKYRM